METDSQSDRVAVERRFEEVFSHLGFLCAYAHRRGARDPDAIAAEAMAVAWRRLADVPTDDARPWLIVTTRNLLRAERRRERGAGEGPLDDAEPIAPAQRLSPELELDPKLAQALQALSDTDREALLLIAWDDLTPRLAAASLGISAPAFRVRLHRARRRLGALLADPAVARAGSAPQPKWRNR